MGAQADDAKPFPASVVGLAAAGGKIHRELQRLSEQYDFIIVDCPPSVTSPVPQSVLLVSDLVIIPTRPSLADIWGVKDTLGLVDRAKVFNENLKVAFLVNALTPRTQLGKDSLEVLETMHGHLFKAVFRQRQAYAQSLVLGGTVFNVPGAKEAQQEVTALGKEVLALLGQK
ncbi:AAA family ATPase [Malikia granosa]|uniref:Cobyrinic acid a,c-diamide synthase n=1 Tax=Malikia granosa TaxID=263067 RepID=A0A2S9K2Z4_9BURK|nr:AAA family ATPase [Malikia granosa]PRD64848.1 cobyrinic acid a,c-diamide synthase [Malikia granosa]